MSTAPWAFGSITFMLHSHIYTYISWVKDFPLGEVDMSPLYMHSPLISCESARSVLLSPGETTCIPHITATESALLPLWCSVGIRFIIFMDRWNGKAHWKLLLVEYKIVYLSACSRLCEHIHPYASVCDSCVQHVRFCALRQIKTLLRSTGTSGGEL